MTSGKQRDLTPVLPKKVRNNFFILLLLLILFPASILAILNVKYNISLRTHELSGLTGILPYIMICASLICSVMGISSKSYTKLATIGCSLLITAFLYSIFGNNSFDLQLLICIILSAVLTLMLAINMSICQLGPPQTAYRRLCFAYTLIPFLFCTFFVIGNIIDFSSIPDSMAPFLKLIPAALALLTLYLWVISMKKKIWILVPSEDENNPKPSHSIIGIMALLLSHMLLLSSLWFILHIAYNRHLDLELLLILFIWSLGVFFASYWSKNTRGAMIIHRLVVIVVCATLVLFLAYATRLIPYSAPSDRILTAIVFINALCIPLCLANCRRALIARSSSKIGRWTQLCLLLNYPASLIVFSRLFYSASLISFTLLIGIMFAIAFKSKLLALLKFKLKA